MYVRKCVCVFRKTTRKTCFFFFFFLVGPTSITKRHYSFGEADASGERREALQCKTDDFNCFNYSIWTTMMHVTFVNGSSLSVQRALTDTTQRGGRNTTGTVYLLDRPLKKYHGLHVICQVMWKGVVVDQTSHTFFMECKYYFARCIRYMYVKQYLLGRAPVMQRYTMPTA